MKRYFFLVFALIALAGRTFETYAQEIKANVTINVEQLDFESRNDVSTMKSDLESYINNQQFTNMDWEGDPIPVEMTIALSGGSNNRYSARMFIASRRILDGPEDPPGETTTIKFFEQKWSFEYARGASLTYNPLRFDEFNTLIDYYMLIIIGYDLDSYNALDGTRAFEQAKNLVQLGISADAEGYSANSQLGEFTKYNLISELVDMRFEAFRTSITSYYVDGLDRMDFNEEEAKTAIKFVIKDMADFKEKKATGPSTLMQAFFDTKSREIASLFNGEDDPELFKNLKYIDPSNAILYEEAERGEL